MCSHRHFIPSSISTINTIFKHILNSRAFPIKLCLASIFCFTIGLTSRFEKTRDYLYCGIEMASADILTVSSSTPNYLHLENPSAAILEAAIFPKRKRSEETPLIDMANMTVPKKLPFLPEDHLNFTSPPKVFTMKDLSLPEDTGISPVAVSEPFQLFTPEAIQQMRAEILSKPVWENYQYSSNLSQCQLRGFAPEWVVPQTLRHEREE